MKPYSSLKGNPKSLKQYDDIVTAQKELGIVEEVKSPGVKGEVLLSTAPLSHKER